MKLVLKILFIVFFLWMGVGVFLLKTDHPKAQFVIGLDVLYLSFILMPLFIYHRYKGGNYKKYQLNDEKLKELIKNKDS